MFHSSDIKAKIFLYLIVLALLFPPPTYTGSIFGKTTGEIKRIHEERQKTKSEKLIAERKKKKMVDELLKEANVYYGAGRWYKTIDICERIFLIDPGNERAKKGIALARKKINEEKSKNEELARKTREKEIAQLLIKGKKYFNSRKWSKAINEFNKVLNLEPMNIQANELITKAKEKQKEDKYSIKKISIRKEKYTIAVMDLQAQGVSAIDAVVISDLLRTAIVTTNAFTIVERGRLDQVIGELGYQQSGCTEQECAVKIGKMLNAKKIVVGSVGRLGKLYLINIRLVDVETGKVESADQGECSSIEETRIVVKRLAERLAIRR